jgi:uncharacterized phage protein (TIGR02218 family)
MKDLSAGTLAHYQLSTTAIAELWRVTRTDAQVFGWTSHDRDLVIAGVTYRASEGLLPTSSHSSDTLQVDTMDVTAFLDVSTEAEIAAGVWDGAEVVNAEVIWSNLPAALDNNVYIKRVGTLGEVQRQNNIFVAEIRGAAHKLLTRVGRLYGPTCPWRHARWNGSTYVASVECGLDLTGRIHTGTVTSVSATPALAFSDSAQSQASGYFSFGYITMTSGDNNGITREVRRWENKLFSLLRPFPYPVEVGDAYSAVIGDDHTYETCRDVLDNLVPAGGGGFGGFSTVPGNAAVYASPVHG